MNLLRYSLLATFSVCLCSANQVSDSQQKWVKHYAKQKNIVPPTEALIQSDAEPDFREGFVSLYNGKDLSGWTPRGGHCTFEASGDSIVGTCVPGSPSTYLSTDRNDYTDFIFTAEVKWEVDGNSGIMFRASSRKGSSGNEIVYGPQCEMEGFSQDRGWSGGIYGQSAGAWFYPLWLDAHEEARKALKKDQWNRIAIQAIGKDIKTWINGVPAAHWIDEEFGEGFFSLQVHSGKQGKIHFRNIKVKEIDAGYEDLFAGGDFSKWTTVDGYPVTRWTIEKGVVERPKINFGDKFPGSIITKEDYKDFDLKFEWKISKGGNSGVKYRTDGHLGLEYQILDDGVHRDSNLSAGIYALVSARDDKPYNPGGQWNSGRIMVKGDRVEHYINGEKVAEVLIGSEDWVERFKKSKYKKHEGFGTWTGPIYLQDHSDRVAFRNVRIKEL
jgi:hypothetical protein